MCTGYETNSKIKIEFVCGYGTLNMNGAAINISSTYYINFL